VVFFLSKITKLETCQIMEINWVVYYIFMYELIHTKSSSVNAILFVPCFLFNVSLKRICLSGLELT